MADPAWPFGCPTGWSQKPRVSTIRSEVDAGVPKTRARFTKSYLEMQAQWTFDDWSELPALENFFKVDLNDGAKAFTMKHPMTGAVLRVRFKDAFSVSSDVTKKPTFNVTGELEEALT